LRRSPEVKRAQRCLCATVRRTARLLTRRYEEALKPAGVTVSQYELMNVVRATQPVEQTRLVKIMETDQTTMSRNMRLLVEAGWLEAGADERDGRRRNYKVSSAGIKALQEARHCWHEVHEQMENELGLGELWPLLDRIQSVARGGAGKA
jgi:DNA-binding MarR family transcriptional regulator